MIKSKALTPVLFALAAVFILGAVVLLAFVVPGATSVFYRVCTVLLAIFAVLAGVGMLYYLYLARDNDHHFFLYDPQKDRNDDPDTLDFARVNSRMTYFMTTISTSQERLWMENELAVNPARFGVRGIYRPLAAYKMLYDLAKIDTPEAWRFFLCAKRETIDTLTDVLREAGDDKMPQALRRAFDSATGVDDYADLRDYLQGNLTFIERQMMRYVKKNMEWFY